jgi:predicted GNAT family acetyltransferase
MSAAPAVKHNAAENQFESPTAHGLARLRYVQRGDVLDLTHTSVPQDAEGQGIGSQLARTAFEHAKAKGLRVMPSCPFVHAWLRKHPEFEDVVVSS